MQEYSFLVNPNQFEGARLLADFLPRCQCQPNLAFSGGAQDSEPVNVEVGMIEAI